MAGHKLLINISELINSTNAQRLWVHNNVSSWGEHSEHLPSDFNANFCTFSTQTDIKIKALYTSVLFWGMAASFNLLMTA